MTSDGTDSPIGRLLAFPGIACPVCHNELQLAGSSIRCIGCARRFPVRDGLPVLIRAEVVPSDAGAGNSPA